MKCPELQFDLALFSDDVLSEDEQNPVREHLATCPLCRQKLDDIRLLRNDLRGLVRPEIPVTLLSSLRASVREALAASRPAPVFVQLNRTRRWSETWLMPSAIGGVATVLLGFGLFSVILSREIKPETASRPSPSNTSIYLASIDGQTPLTPSVYARSRMGAGVESPSINPQGALIALTKSLVRGETHDDEVTVVADVFGDGLARIAEVVEPSHNEHAVEQLQKALESDPSLAPFVPANLDQRADPIRVVLKIQNVNVPTGVTTTERFR